MACRVQAQGISRIVSSPILCALDFSVRSQEEDLGVRALVLAVLSVPKPLVTSYCQMASLSEPVVSTSALNITTLIPFPRWWQRDNALGTLESLERNVLVPFQEDSGICQQPGWPEGIEAVSYLLHSLSAPPCYCQGSPGGSVPLPGTASGCCGCWLRRHPYPV